VHARHSSRLLALTACGANSVVPDGNNSLVLDTEEAITFAVFTRWQTGQSSRSMKSDSKTRRSSPGLACATVLSIGKPWGTASRSWSSVDLFWGIHTLRLQRNKPVYLIRRSEASLRASTPFSQLRKTEM